MAEQHPELTGEKARIWTGSADQEGRLIFAADLLVAIAVQLSAAHGLSAGSWSIEYLGGRKSARSAPLFPTLEAAFAWISFQLKDTRPFEGPSE